MLRNIYIDLKQFAYYQQQSQQQSQGRTLIQLIKISVSRLSKRLLLSATAKFQCSSSKKTLRI